MKTVAPILLCALTALVLCSCGENRNKKTAATKKRCGRSIIRPMTLQTPWLCAPAFRQVCPLCGFRLSKSAYYYQVYDIIIGDSDPIVNTKMPKKPTFVNFRVITHRFQCVLTESSQRFRSKHTTWRAVYPTSPTIRLFKRRTALRGNGLEAVVVSVFDDEGVIAVDIVHIHITDNAFDISVTSMLPHTT